MRTAIMVVWFRQSAEAEQAATISDNNNNNQSL
jgi:hypothetical protein